MLFDKETLCQMDRCYATAVIPLHGKPHAVFATEGRGPCYAYDLENPPQFVTIWEEPGGCMNLVPIPHRTGEFLAIQRFFRLYDWEEAELVYLWEDGQGGFQSSTLFRLPYLHRFDLFQDGDDIHLVCCTLAAQKSSREDWSHPGAVFTAHLSGDFRRPVAPQLLRDGLFQNHGYERVAWEGRQAGMLACQQGVFLLFPPESPTQDWEMRPVLQTPASDCAIIDIDRDGKPEIALIEPFHGNQFCLYRDVGTGYEKFYEHPDYSEFYHVATAGILNGLPYFLSGCRKGNRQLFLLGWNDRKRGIEQIVVEEGVGPSNAVIVNIPGRDLILSANRETAHAAIYYPKGEA